MRKRICPPISSGGSSVRVAVMAGALPVPD
jgi:hypothetical protein